MLAAFACRDTQAQRLGSSSGQKDYVPARIVSAIFSGYAPYGLTVLIDLVLLSSLGSANDDKVVGSEIKKQSEKPVFSSVT
uniref:Uncharacterized protein n=1 Tax=Aquisalinus luteolus TaxID=1566827 RepID=A0A8J3A1W7_9PROT|nr:hypothetical protein GCM10011355_15150 [Aquisalinus luteolus]